MEIADGFELRHLCLYIDYLDTLVVGDVHLGYEENLAKQGVFLPKFQFEEILEEVNTHLENLQPTHTVVVGDLKHEFGRISDEEWRDTLSFIDTIQEVSDLILTRGNHDTLLGPIVDKRDVTVKDSHRQDNTLFLHGHELPDTELPEYIVMGHEHPAIGLRDGARAEVYKCFLRGVYEQSTVIVVPSISTLPEGTDVTQERLRSPFIEDVREFKAFVVQDKVYDFGRVGEID